MAADKATGVGVAVEDETGLIREVSRLYEKPGEIVLVYANLNKKCQIGGVSTRTTLLSGPKGSVAALTLMFPYECEGLIVAAETSGHELYVCWMSNQLLERAMASEASMLYRRP